MIETIFDTNLIIDIEEQRTGYTDSDIYFEWYEENLCDTAIRLLGEIGDKQAIDPLREFLKREEHPEVKITTKTQENL